MYKLLYFTYYYILMIRGALEIFFTKYSPSFEFKNSKSGLYAKRHEYVQVMHIITNFLLCDSFEAIVCVRKVVDTYSFE